MAYDRHGHLDQNRLQLLTRGHFVTREEAAALPNRLPRPSPRTTLSSVGGGSSTPEDRRPRPAAVVPRAGRGAMGSGTWDDEETGLLVRLHARRVSFPEIRVGNVFLSSILGVVGCLGVVRKSS